MRLRVGLVLADHPHDDSRLLRRTPEERRLAVFEVQVIKHRKRFENHIVAILEDRHAAAEVKRENGRRLTLLLGELQQVARVRETLDLKRKQHTPGVRTAAAPVNVDRHDFPRRLYFLADQATSTRGGDCNGNLLWCASVPFASDEAMAADPK